MQFERLHHWKDGRCTVLPPSLPGAGRCVKPVKISCTFYALKHERIKFCPLKILSSKRQSEIKYYFGEVVAHHQIVALTFVINSAK